jgi:hypothetical protein
MIKNNQSELKDTLKKASAMQLTMTVESGLIPRFYQILGQGFVIKTQMGCSIKNLLCLKLGIHDKYLEQRIQTIFLNGKAVDDIDSAIVEDGSTLALSGPMPGLVGATLRRGGFFAAMRSQISYDSDSSEHHKGEFSVTLKLFNLVAKELGPGFLQRGVWLKGKQLQDFISENFDYLKKKCKSLKLDEQNIDLSKLSNTDFTNKSVFLQITTTVDA